MHPSKHILKSLEGVPRIIARSFEDDIRRNWFSHDDHVCEISPIDVDNYFTDLEKDRLGSTLREFWKQLTGKSDEALANLPNGDRFIFYGSPKKHWYFSCMLKMVPEIAQACIMKTSLFLNPILRRWIEDLALHLEAVDSKLLDDYLSEELRTCASCRTRISSGRVFACLAGYIMRPYANSGISTRCEHSLSWGFGFGKTEATRQRVLCSKCVSSNASGCCVQLGKDKFCSSQWIAVPYDIYNAIISLISENIREMPALAVDATSEPVFTSPIEIEDHHHRFYIRTNDSQENESSDLQHLTRYARIFLLARVVELATEQPLTAYVEEKIGFAARENYRIDADRRLAKLDSVGVSLMPPNPQSQSASVSELSASSIDSIIAATVAATTKRVIEDMNNGVIQPLKRIIVDQIYKDKVYQSHMDYVLQTIGADTFVLQEKIDRQYRILNATDSSLNKLSTRIASAVISAPQRRPNAALIAPPPAFTRTPAWNTTFAPPLSLASIEASPGGLYLPPPSDTYAAPICDDQYVAPSRFLDIANWTAYLLDEDGLKSIAKNWTIDPAALSTSFACPICEKFFKETTPEGKRIIYLYDQMSPQFVSEVFKLHRGRKCPYGQILNQELGEEFILLRTFLSYAKGDAKNSAALEATLNCKALFPWLANHGGYPRRLTGVFANKGVSRAVTQKKHADIRSFLYFWEGDGVGQAPIPPIPDVVVESPAPYRLPETMSDAMMQIHRSTAMRRKRKGLGGACGGESDAKRRKLTALPELVLPEIA